MPLSLKRTLLLLHLFFFLFIIEFDVEKKETQKWCEKKRNKKSTLLHYYIITTKMHIVFFYMKLQYIDSNDYTGWSTGLPFYYFFFSLSSIFLSINPMDLSHFLLVYVCISSITISYHFINTSTCVCKKKKTKILLQKWTHSISKNSKMINVYMCVSACALPNNELKENKLQ